MGTIRTFRDLIVWQKSMVLVTEIYQLTKIFPKDEMYGLTSQMRRSAVSVPSNIAEGYGRNSTNDYVRFLRIACGSLYELQTQLEISVSLQYIDTDRFGRVNIQAVEVVKMLSSMISKINNSNGENHGNKI